MKCVRIDIEGLQLNETQDKVRDQLEGVIGVQKVNTSPGQSYVDVMFDEQTSDSEINSHLQNNGYKVTDMNLQ